MLLNMTVLFIISHIPYIVTNDIYIHDSDIYSDLYVIDIFYVDLQLLIITVCPACNC